MEKLILYLLTLISRSTFFTRVVSSLIYYVFFKLIKYRYSVVYKNINRCYPNKTKAEAELMARQYYSVLKRYIIEIITLIDVSADDIRKKITCHPPEENIISGGKILMASHCGNWEVNIVALPLFTTTKVVGFYKPISNKVLDKLMLKIRSKFGLELHPIENTIRLMQQYKNQDVWYVFISDQSPLNMNGVHWQQFFGQNTPWLNGAEKLAIRYNYPVYYLHQKAIEQDINKWYNLVIEPISTQVNTCKPGEIMEKYVEIVQSDIESQPTYWLWSHKRWKRANLGQ